MADDDDVSANDKGLIKATAYESLLTKLNEEQGKQYLVKCSKTINYLKERFEAMFETVCEARLGSGSKGIKKNRQLSEDEFLALTKLVTKKAIPFAILQGAILIAGIPTILIPWLVWHPGGDGPFDDDNPWFGGNLQYIYYRARLINKLGREEFIKYLRALY